MKNTKIIAIVSALLIAGGLTARPHHHKHDDGLRLAAGIVGLVANVLAPTPVVVAAPPPPPPPPVVVTPPPAPVVVTPAPAPVVVPAYGYGWYNDVWVPCYNDWYWYNGTWVWRGVGPRPVPPRWVPDPRRRVPPPPPRIHRPAPPRVHHRPAPPPRVNHHRPAPPRATPPSHGHRPPAARPPQGGHRPPAAKPPQGGRGGRR